MTATATAGLDAAGDYYVVECPSVTWFVDAETAARVSRQLLRPWVRWLRFVDHAGSRTWVRKSTVRHVYESTAAQRERDRAFHRARESEPGWE